MNTVPKLAASAALAFTANTTSAEDIIVATDTAFVPFGLRENGEFTGFEIEMWETIAADLELE